MNIVVIEGHLNRPTETRVLPSGETVLSLEVAIAAADGTTDSVPVSWFDPPATASALTDGDRIVVLGRVRRYFWRAAGRTQSRTDVLAEHVVPQRQRKRIERLLQEAAGRLGDGGG